MKTIGWIVSYLIVTVGGTMYNGYALSIMWKWFVVPALNVPAISTAYAIGIAIIAGYLTKSITPNRKDERSAGEKLRERVMVAALKPTFGLVFGYVVTLFI